MLLGSISEPNFERSSGLRSSTEARRLEEARVGYATREGTFRHSPVIGIVVGIDTQRRRRLRTAISRRTPDSK